MVHVLWSEQTGPIVCYCDKTKAENHQRTMLGVELAMCAADFGSVAAGRMVSVVWSKTSGPIAAFVEAASAHSAAMLVETMMVNSCEVRRDLPDIVTDDIASDFDGDDDTPEIASDEHHEIDVRIVDIDDA
jgi:hypothetical protein